MRRILMLTLVALWWMQSPSAMAANFRVSECIALYAIDRSSGKEVFLDLNCLSPDVQPSRQGYEKFENKYVNLFPLNQYEEMIRDLLPRLADDRLKARKIDPALVLATLTPGGSVASVARGHGVSASLLYAWRREVLTGALTPTAASSIGFVPVEISEAPEDEDAIASNAGPGQVEIVLGNGRLLRVAVTIGTEALVRLVTALEQS